MAEKKKAWLYLKARTDEDLKAQKSLLLEYADKAGYEVTEVAADYSPSQSSLKYVRLGAAKHDFEVLLISSWNRLGRDLSETLDTMTELKNQNIAVQSVKEKNLSLDRVLSIAAHLQPRCRSPMKHCPKNWMRLLSRTRKNQKGLI